ncbi:MAG TPA: glycoside hydrolase family 32 protein [Verrucomicrobiae bacterium]
MRFLIFPASDNLLALSCQFLGRTSHLLRRVVLYAAFLTAAHLQAADDILIADFEGADYGSWKTTGEAFGPGPARGTLPGQMHVDGYMGKGLANSFYQGDTSTGTLTSPEFRIERRFITFLIGGGKDTQKTCINLLVGGKIVRNATGPNDKSGGTEALAPSFWDVSELAGARAVIQIVDMAKGGWGHINVDQIVQTDRKPPMLLANAKRSFKIEKRYLNIPIKNGAPLRVVTTLVDGKAEVRNDIELADGKPDWWAPMDVSGWRGKTVTLQVDKLREDSRALSAIEESDAIQGAENLYREPLRGQFHFSPRRGWNNDPNGMVFYRGEYHLFFQHNPYGWKWGNMHWGHAVSRDMVHWRELGDVMAPDALGAMFSGSAVVDWSNTSGLGTPSDPAQVLIYTAAGNTSVQCLASSTDGRSYTKFSGNPVVKQITGGNRDPKVIWHSPSGKWVMTLYVEKNKVHTIQFLSSPDLKNWTVMSETAGFFECPDFFELPIDGDAKQTKWVLTAASSEYMVGTFDGTKFTPETGKLPGHRGQGFYAAQTFSDMPIKDGRRVQMGWFQTPTPGMPFNQSMTIPLELKLTQTGAGPRLTWTPVAELARLRHKSHRVKSITLDAERANPLAGIKGELVELAVEIEPGTASEVVFNVRGATIAYDAKAQELVVNKMRAPAPLRAGKQRLRIFCDRMALEVFASDGLTYVPMPFIPKLDNMELGVTAQGGRAKLAALEVHELKSAWSNQ